MGESELTAALHNVVSEARGVVEAWATSHLVDCVNSLREAIECLDDLEEQEANL